MWVYPTDRILSGSGRRPRSWVRSCRVWWRSGIRGVGLRRWQHRSEPVSMTNPSIPWLGVASMLASRSPFGYVGRGRGSLSPANDLAARQERYSGKRLPARRYVSAPFGGPRRPGWRVHSQLRQQMCSVVRSRWDTAFALELTSVEDSDFSGGNVGEVSFGRFVRSCRQLYGAWHASLVTL